MPFDTLRRPTKFTNEADVAIAKGMLLRGDPNHDVSAWFGLNPGRVANIKSGKAEGAKWKHVQPAPPHELPPPGPYSYFSRPGTTNEEQTQQALARIHMDMAQDRATLREALATIREELRVQANERRQTNEKIEAVLRVQAETRRDLGQLDTKPPKPTGRRPIES